jgi:signal transduction histidine kinase
MRAHLPDRFAPGRRHLTFLVGVLTLMFLLTGVLAVNAHRADASRQEQADAALDNLVASAAADWAVHVQERLVAALETTYRGAIRELIRDRHAPLETLASRTQPQIFCELCRSADDAVTHFSIDLATGTAEQAGPIPLTPARLAELAAHAVAGPNALIHDSLAVSIELREAGSGRAAVVYTRIGPDGEPVRATGHTLSSELLGESIGAVFGLVRLLPPTTGTEPSKHALLSRRAYIGSTVLLAGAEDAAGARSRVELAEPVSGLVLEVGLRAGAADRLLIGGAVPSRLPLFAALMIAITVLLVMALMLVRREAELVRLRADFVSSVSHELRTPLAQIRMFAETLLLGRVRSDVERRRSLEIIDQEARRLTRLVENVLTFSKSDGGRKQPLAPEPTLLAAEIRSAVEGFAPLCRTRSVDVRLELQEGITAPVDREALRQVLVNLLENALKYGPTGQRVTVGAALYDDLARIWVDDEGPGIPAGERERVFDSFYRVEQVGGRRHAGSGIGLAVVRELTKLHGGSARAEEAPGGGARLTIELPGGARIPESGRGWAAAS